MFCLVGPAAVLAAEEPAASAPNLKKLDRVLQSLLIDHKGDKPRVIVRAKRGYEDWVRALFATRGAEVSSDLRSIGGLSLELDEREIASYSNLDAIESLSVDSDISPTASNNDTARFRSARHEPAAVNSY